MEVKMHGRGVGLASSPASLIFLSRALKKIGEAGDEASVGHRCLLLSVKFEAVPDDARRLHSQDKKSYDNCE